MNGNDKLYSELITIGLVAQQRGTIEFIKITKPKDRIPSELHSRILYAFCKFTGELYETDTSFHWLSKKDYFSSISHIWLVFKNTQLIGFSAIKTLDGCGEKIIYIDNMNIQRISGKIFKKYSIGTMLVNEILQENSCFFFKLMSIIFRTQNANVYRLGYSILPSGVFPRVSNDKARDEDRSIRINKFMANVLSPDKKFIEKNSIIKNAYHGCIYGSGNKAIHTKYSDIKSFWNANIDLENGDAVLISVCPKRYEFIAAICLYRFHIIANKFKYLLPNRT